MKREITIKGIKLYGSRSRLDNYTAWICHDKETIRKLLVSGILIPWKFDGERLVLFNFKKGDRETDLI